MDHLYVNTTRSNKLRVDFDISFPELSCNLLSLDAFDDTGSPMKDAIHEIYKHRLSKSGEKEGHPQRQELGNTLQTEKQLENEAKKHAESKKDKEKERIICGNCYGAGGPGECCNSCQDVKDAYSRMGWHFKSQGISQCEADSIVVNKRDQFSKDGGCQVYGRLELNKGIIRSIFSTLN